MKARRKQTAATTAPASNPNPLNDLARWLNNIQPDGRIAIPINVRLSPNEWMMVAQAAAHESRTIHHVLSDLLCGHYEGSVNPIFETLDDYLVEPTDGKAVRA